MRKKIQRKAPANGHKIGKKIRTAVALEYDQFEKVRQKALTKGVSFASAFRDVLDEGLNISGDWPPIETAPKDGSIILIASSDFSIVRRVQWSGVSGLWMVVDTSKLIVQPHKFDWWLPSPKGIEVSNV